MKTRSLAKKVEFYITPTSPFNFDGTFYNPSHFADGLTDWEPGVYWQSIRIGKHLFGLKIRDKGSLEYPKIKVSVFYDEKISPADLQSIKNEIIWRFDLNADLKEFNILMEKDKRFYPVFKKWIGMRNSSPHGLYELLIIALVLQNTTVHRTIQMLKILLETYGMALSFDNKLILVIWEPQTLIGVTEQELRNLKIGYRAKFMKHLSQDFIEGKINENELRTLDQADVKKELMKLYGIGPETARILLFDVCHQYNTFDYIAPWQQKIYSQLFYRKPLVSTEKIRKYITKKYNKYSMLAVHYIWEDLFWRRRTEKIDWLEKEMRL